MHVELILLPLMILPGLLKPPVATPSNFTLRTPLASVVGSLWVIELLWKKIWSSLKMWHGEYLCASIRYSPCFVDVDTLGSRVAKVL